MDYSTEILITIADDGAAPLGAGFFKINPARYNLVATSNFTCALHPWDYHVKCWGEAGTFGMGYEDLINRGSSSGDMGENLPPLNLGTNVHPVQLASGLTHVCAIMDDRRVKCWGRNDKSQLGNGAFSTIGDNSGEMGDNLAYVNGGNLFASKLALGWKHSCAILENSQVSCWGDNYYGQLGIGTTSSYESSPQLLSGGLMNMIDIAAGDEFACALSASGKVYCWGRNDKGQLGNGSFVDSSSPVMVSSLSQIREIAAGPYHVCATNWNGNVYCWGDDSFFQMGGAGGKNSPYPISGLTGVTGLSTYWGSCVQDSGGNTKCWGYNNVGQLGINSTANQSSPNLISDVSGLAATAIGSSHTCGISSNGNVTCWGYGTGGRLGRENTNNYGDVSTQSGSSYPMADLNGLGPISLGTNWWLW